MQDFSHQQYYQIPSDFILGLILRGLKFQKNHSPSKTQIDHHVVEIKDFKVILWSRIRQDPPIPRQHSSFEKIQWRCWDIDTDTIVLQYHIYSIHACIWGIFRIQYAYINVSPCAPLLKIHWNFHIYCIYWTNQVGEKSENDRISTLEPSRCGALVFSNKCSGSTSGRVVCGSDWKWLEPE